MPYFALCAICWRKARKCTRPKLRAVFERLQRFGGATARYKKHGVNMYLHIGVVDKLIVKIYKKSCAFYAKTVALQRNI